MTLHVRLRVAPPRLRAAALLVLAVALVSGGSPVAVAASPGVGGASPAVVGGSPDVGGAPDPAAAVDALLDAVVAKQWDRLPDLVCPAQVEAVAARLDQRLALSGAGTDPTPLIEAMTLSIRDRSVALESAADATATVTLGGVLAMTVEPEAARRFVHASLASAGQPTDDQTVDDYLAFFLASLDDGIDLAASVQVVRDDGGGWVVCDDLTADEPDDGLGPDGSLAPARDPLCGLMTLEELNAATGLAFVTATEFDEGCSWDSAIDAGYYNISVFRDTGGLASIKEVWKFGREVQLGDRTAWATRDGTWVDLGGGHLLTIMPYLEGAPETAALDPREVARVVGQIVVPRLP